MSESEASTVVQCICEGRITDNSEVIACDMCSVWYHRKCSGLLKRQFKFFETHSDLFKWFCKKCQDEGDQKKYDDFLNRRSLGAKQRNPSESDNKKLLKILNSIDTESAQFKQIVEPQIFALIQNCEAEEQSMRSQRKRNRMSKGDF